MGPDEEVKEGVKSISRVLNVQFESKNYACRGSKDIRVYLDAFTKEKDIEKLKSEIEALEYCTGLGIDRVLLQANNLRIECNHHFGETGYNELCELHDVKVEKIYVDALKILLRRKDELIKLPIECIITSIFSFLFQRFNFDEAKAKAILEELKEDN